MYKTCCPVPTCRSGPKFPTVQSLQEKRPNERGLDGQKLSRVQSSTTNAKLFKKEIVHKSIVEKDKIKDEILDFYNV